MATTRRGLVIQAPILLTSAAAVCVTLLVVANADATLHPSDLHDAMASSAQIATNRKDFTTTSLRKKKTTDEEILQLPTSPFPHENHDVILPEGLSEEAKGNVRRRLASQWRLIGANIPFQSGPTLSALNASFFRYSSVPSASAIDWRKSIYVTPIQVQYDCASCWVVAAADSVAMANAIASNTGAVSASVQQVCDCSSLTCCQGGWPEDAFSWIVSQGNITTSAYYNYWASDARTCTLSQNYPISAYVTGWERVPSYSQLALMQAVTMQPVVVYISASASDFQKYYSSPPGTANFSVYDGKCSGEVNHALVVVGYNTTASTPYWILKNSWGYWNSTLAPYWNTTTNTYSASQPLGWGDGGYMYIAMYDGPGKCGMLTVNPLFPTYYPNLTPQATVSAGSTWPVVDDDFIQLWTSTYSTSTTTSTTTSTSASTSTSTTSSFATASSTSTSSSLSISSTSQCSGMINPCGNGTCYLSNGAARCNCPSKYVEVLGSPTSKCVPSSPCSVAVINPCGAGTCLDTGDGTFICGCPNGYAIGTSATGAPTCVPLSSLNLTSTSYTYTTQYGDLCSSIQSAYNMNSTVFATLNPYVKCGKKLVQGIVVTVTAASGVACNQLYSVRQGDTCTGISYGIDKGGLVSSLSGKSSVSSSGGTPPSEYSILGSTQWTSYWYNTNTLSSLNPAINCSSLWTSQQLCISASSTSASAVPLVCGLTYTTVKGDTCSSIKKAYNLNDTFFTQLNPGLNCYWTNGATTGVFNPGLQICVSNNATSSVKCNQYYSVQQGDTCAQIWNAANLSQSQLQYINPGLQCQNPYLYVGQQICIDSPLLASIPDSDYLVYTIQPGDTLSTVQAQYASRCQAYSITLPKIAAQNGIANWTTYVLPTSGTIVIPCVPKVGATCGCTTSLYVCGADLVTYPSYCDARCNFATPVVNSTNGCNTCQNACAGRYGQYPSPTSACPAGTVCPWPAWSPPLSDATAQFTTSPLCSYRTQTCTNVCALYGSTIGDTSTYCYNQCMACYKVPCSGPQTTAPKGSTYCPTCASSGCANYYTSGTTLSRTSCDTVCTYWNTWWNPLNP